MGLKLWFLRPLPDRVSELCGDFGVGVLGGAALARIMVQKIINCFNNFLAVSSGQPLSPDYFHECKSLPHLCGRI